MENYILPFIEYYNSDKSQYPFANTIENPKTGKPYIDEDNDFLVGNSGGFLMNMSFKFINTHLFSEVAINFEKNKNNKSIVSWVESLDIKKSENRNKYYYCPHLKGTKEYEDFWKRETFRRRNGITLPCKLLPNGKIEDLHITGDFYHYLNYGRILRTPNEKEKELLHEKGDFKTTMISGFPRFWDGDYWNFKIDFFIANNFFHLSKAKARGKGYSYKRGNQAANTVNLIPNATVIMAAYDSAYLTDQGATSDMIKTSLDWLEDNTHWKRLYLSESLTNIELGYKTKKGGNKKFGWRSKALSVSLFNNPSAAIGKRALEIDFEESGKCPNLEEALDVTLSSTEVGAGNVGTIRCYGTAGVKGKDWIPFSNIYYNPVRYKMMPFENVWDDNARNTVCGFFHPQILNMEPYIDKDGNSLLEEAYKYDLHDKEEYAKENSTDKWLAYVGQRANKPSEAFKSISQNIFSSPGLSSHINTLQNNSGAIAYRDGMLFDIDGKLQFKTNKQLASEGLQKFVHPYIEDVPFNIRKDFYGCIREFYPPFKVNDEIPDNLYVVVYDSVGKDKKSDLVIGKNSLNSIHVIMYPNSISNTTGDIIVASYAGRPDTMEEADKIAYKLCKYYNAKLLPEVDRGTVVENFKKWKVINRVMLDPKYTFNNIPIPLNNPSYGVTIGEGDNASEALIGLSEWLYTKVSETDESNNVYTYHYISDIPTLLELENFNVEGNFDRISSLRLYPIARRVRQFKRQDEVIKKHTVSKSIFKEIGLYGYGR